MTNAINSKARRKKLAPAEGRGHAVRWRLPSLGALRVFEASARLESFLEASEELTISASAVSYQIRALEQELGVKLFDRSSHRGLRLSPEGRAFLPKVQAAFDLIAEATGDLRRREARHSLNLAIMDSFATIWLMPRLHRFNARYPDIDLHIVPADRTVDLLREGFDLAVRYGDGRWPGSKVELFLEDHIFPVCAPELAKSGRLHQPSDLARHRLIHQYY